MRNEVVFRLREMLISEWEAFHCRTQPFAEAIASANKPGKYRRGKEKGIDKFDYRKLGRFFKNPGNDSFQFSISELRALDRYFTLQQQSLCSVPIFYREKSVLDNLAESGDVTFAIATRFLAVAHTETVSRWDLRAMELLLNKGAFENTNTGIVDIFHHGSEYDDIKKEHWNHIFDERRSSIISFGSPFACHATEKTLAVIFGVAPYIPPVMDRDNMLPLYFVWPGSKNKQYVDTSGFLIERKNIPKLYDKDSGVMQSLCRCDRGLIVGDNWYASDRVGQSYGLFVAQRQSKNCIYSTIIGTFAPNTYTVAQSLAEGKIPGRLPPYDGRYTTQPVLIAVVQASTEERPKDGAKRETRTISSPYQVCHTALWTKDKSGSWYSERRVQSRTR